jgi:hypothetical protein
MFDSADTSLCCMPCRLDLSVDHTTEKHYFEFYLLHRIILLCRIAQFVHRIATCELTVRSITIHLQYNYYSFQTHFHIAKLLGCEVVVLVVGSVERMEALHQKLGLEQKRATKDIKVKSRFSTPREEYL